MQRMRFNICLDTVGFHQAMEILLKRILAVVLLVLSAGAPQAGPGSDHLLQALHALSRPLSHPDHLNPLLDAAGSARLVLMGEASHGTREFYSWRDRLSRRLVVEDGFSFIAIEADWTSLLPLDRYVRHRPGAPASAREALLQIERWPRWLWANSDLELLGEWLRAFNRARPARHRVGIHGIDLYAIWKSLDAVEAFYRTRLPQSAARVQSAYRLLQEFRGRYRAYADQVRHAHGATSEIARVRQDLAVLYRNAPPSDRDALFEALQHAKVVESGERYLRTLTKPGPQSWNARAGHFERMVADLLEHYGPASRAIVWAHNTHIGDARATDMAGDGEVNLGQLVRERYGRETVFALGFGTATGTVLAARTWEGPRETMLVPWPRRDSLEAALLALGDSDRVLFLQRVPPGHVLRRLMWPHRAIGVVFRPEDEPRANYVPTRLADRYDAFVFLPLTQALEPLDPER
jgi:erythromycin esterase-like protein